MKLRIITMLMLTIIVLNGCIEAKTIENLGIMSIYGVDVAEDNQANTTTVFYQFASNKGLTKIATGKGKTLSEAQQQMNYKVGYRMEAGSIQFELFGKKAAERGLMRYLSSAIRNVRASNSR